MNIFVNKVNEEKKTQKKKLKLISFSSNVDRSMRLCSFTCWSDTWMAWCDVASTKRLQYDLCTHTLIYTNDFHCCSRKSASRTKLSMVKKCAEIDKNLSFSHVCNRQTSVCMFCWKKKQQQQILETNKQHTKSALKILLMMHCVAHSLWFFCTILLSLAFNVTHQRHCHWQTISMGIRDFMSCESNKML